MSFHVFDVLIYCTWQDVFLRNATKHITIRGTIQQLQIAQVYNSDMYIYK
jgi:hypothetical protein